MDAENVGNTAPTCEINSDSIFCSNNDGTHFINASDCQTGGKVNKTGHWNHWVKR